MQSTPLTQTPASSRGDVSRERLKAAAARLFASRGYNGVTVRELAKAADVNVAAVSYHFGGKKGLYLAALENLMEEMRPIGGPVIARVDAAFDGRAPDRAELPGHIRFVVRHFLTTMLSGDLPPWVVQTVLREFQEPSADYRPMFDERVLPLHRAVRRLTAAALDLPFEADEAILVAHSVMGQIMTFPAMRRVVQEELDWPAFTPDRLETAIAAAGDAALRALDLPLSEEAPACA